MSDNLVAVVFGVLALAPACSGIVGFLVMRRLGRPT